MSVLHAQTTNTGVRRPGYYCELSDGNEITDQSLIVITIVTPYTADVGVAYRILPNSHAVTVDFCDGHRVTDSLAAWSHGHWQFLDGHRL